MSQAIQVDITHIRQRYFEHPVLSVHESYFYNWLIKRLQIVFNVPVTGKCAVLVRNLPFMAEEYILDNLVWSYFRPINGLSRYINENQLVDFRTMGNLIILIF